MSAQKRSPRQFGVDFGERDKAEFVDDQKPISGELFLEAAEALRIAGLHQFMDEGRCGHEAYG